MSLLKKKSFKAQLSQKLNVKLPHAPILGACVSVLTLLAPQTALSAINVFACEPEWAALSDEIGGAKSDGPQLVKSFSATTAFQDAHHIEARPSLIAKTRKADLVVCAGAELEVGWLPLLLRQSGNSSIQSEEEGLFYASHQVDRLEVPEVLDRSLGDIHAMGNPHVHLDPYRMLTIADALSARFKKIDPENSEQYDIYLKDFKSRWSSAIKEWETSAAPLKGKNAVVHHKNFSYLFSWLGVNQVADLEPKPGLPPTSSHLAKLLKTVKQKPTDFIVSAVYQNPKGAKWLSKRSKIPSVVLPYTVGGDKKSTDLFTLMDQTIDLMVNSASSSNQ